MQFSLTDNVEQHPYSSVKFRPNPACWRSRTHFARSRLIVLHLVQPQEPQKFWQYWKKADPHLGLSIHFAGSKRSVSVFHITDTVGFCRGHPRCWVIITTLREPYSKSSRRRCSLIACKAIGTRYVARRGKCFVEHPFYPFYRNRKSIEEGFLQIHGIGSHWHGWKWNSRWGIQ